MTIANPTPPAGARHPSQLTAPSGPACARVWRRSAGRSRSILFIHPASGGVSNRGRSQNASATAAVLSATSSTDLGAHRIRLLVADLWCAPGASACSPRGGPGRGGKAADGTQAVALVAEPTPDVVLMDLRMPGVDGVETARRIASEVGAARGVGVSAPRGAQVPVTLSPRERQVLAAVSRGLSNSRIGAELYITEATIKTQLLRAHVKFCQARRRLARGGGHRGAAARPDRAGASPPEPIRPGVGAPGAPGGGRGAGRSRCGARERIWGSI